MGLHPRFTRGGNLGGVLLPYEFARALDSCVLGQSILGGCEETKTGEDEVLVTSMYTLLHLHPEFESKTSSGEN